MPSGLSVDFCDAVNAPPWFKPNPLSILPFIQPNCLEAVSVHYINCVRADLGIELKISSLIRHHHRGLVRIEQPTLRRENGSFLFRAERHHCALNRFTVGVENGSFNCFAFLELQFDLLRFCDPDERRPGRNVPWCAHFKRVLRFDRFRPEFERAIFPLSALLKRGYSSTTPFFYEETPIFERLFCFLVDGVNRNLVSFLLRC